MSGILSSLTAFLRRWAAPVPLPSADPATVKADLEKLERLWRMIRACITESEKREIVDGLRTECLSELKEIGLDAEDVLDEWGYELLRAKVEGGFFKRKRGGEEASSSDPAARVLAEDALLRDRMARQTEGIVKRFDEVAHQINALPSVLGDGDRARGPTRRLQSSPLVDEACVYDRGEEKEAVVNYLLSDEYATSQLYVIPMVGLAGMGKTTLAQLIYNDLRVAQHFMLRGWMCLSGNLKQMDLMRILVECLKGNIRGYSELDTIHTILQRCIKDRRFFLVLDDFGDEYLHCWHIVKASLCFGSQGSVVIITTQSWEVAGTTGTVPPFYLFKGMSDDSCWSVFKGYAFGGQEDHTTVFEGPGMEGIRKKVIDMCKGVPLMAKSLGLSFRRAPCTEAWMDSVEGITKDVALPALLPRYQTLPAHLKPCLLYCSLFPKGYLFERDHLIRLWMAQGLNPSKNGKRPEDIGDRYFNELSSRSFLIPAEHDDVDGYYMPSLISDLVCSISVNEHSRVEDIDDLPHKARHLSLVCKSIVQCESFYEYNNARSFMVIPTFPFTSILHLEIEDEMFLGMNRLRSLDLSYTNIKRLPESVGCLKHLRFLALNHTKIKRLPESIHKLYNLQILELKQCPRLQELPRGISSLINLRHLDVDSDYLLVHMPFQIHKLTSLQRVPTFNLQKGNEFRRLRELQDLTNLRELGISGLRNVTNVDDVKMAKMQNKRCLEDLELIWPSKDAIPNFEQFSDHDHQNYLNSADNTVKEDEQNVHSLENARGPVEEYSSDEKASSHGVDDKPEKQLDIPDEQESNVLSLQLRDGASNMGIRDSNSSDAAVREEDVLESLCPSATLEKLHIKSYGGAKFPDWIGAPSFSRLVAVDLVDCRCVLLPPLGQLPCLKFLNIDGMLVETIGAEFCGRGNANAFPKLENLYFSNMNKWKRWGGLKKGGFPYLKKLHLFNCPQLMRLPDLLSSLEELKVERCMELTDIPTSPRLEVLKLDCCDGLTALPITLTCLRSLTIMCSQKLISLPPLPQLENLWIEDCEQLTSVVFCSCCPSSAVLSCRIPYLEKLLVANCHQLRFSAEEPLPGVQYSTIHGSLVLSKN